MRAEELLKRLSLDEKCAQVTCVESTSIVDEHGRFDPQKAQELLAHGIGGLSSSTIFMLGHRVDALAQLICDLQDWLLHNTKAKIPALPHTETMSGFACPGAPVYPDPICAASTFEPAFARTMGEQIRRQMLPAGVRHTLAPVLDLAWDIRWGRGSETLGEDHMLAAAMGIPYVEGLQHNLTDGVATTIKHFAGHGLVEGGRNNASVHVGEREFRDIHLYPHEAVVKTAKTQSVMNAYHVIDGVPCTANRTLMTDILRGEWGFDGMVSSDYASIDLLYGRHATAADEAEAAGQALYAGVDLECCKERCYGKVLAQAVRDGKIPEELVDISVLRVLTLKERLGLLDAVTFADPPKAAAVQKSKEDEQTALDIARKGIVLLKNDGALPLAKEVKKVAVIGPFARTLRNYGGHYSCYGLSAHKAEIETEEQLRNYLITPIDLLYDKLAEHAPDVEFHYLEGCSVIGDACDIDAAAALAKEADAVILALGDRPGMFEDGTVGENLDRADMSLYGQQRRLADAVAGAAKKTILTLFGGKPIILEGLEKKVNAILMAWVPGMKGADAAAEIILGKTNPSGKLPVTWPYNMGQMPARYNRLIGSDKVGRSNYVDCPDAPLYAFGHGLSYTSFTYSDLTVTIDEPEQQVTGTVKIENTGDIPGDEVVQLYVRDVVASVSPARMQLIAFKRVALQPGEGKTVQFTIPLELMAFTGIDKKLRTEAGEFVFMAGSASDDIRLQQSAVLEKTVHYAARSVFTATSTIIS